MLRSVLSERFVAVILVTALVAACDTGLRTPVTSVPPTTVPPATVPTPAPSDQAPTLAPSAAPTAAPSPSPTARPATAAHAYAAGGEIEDVSFAPDGRIVVVVRDWEAAEWRVATLNAAGTVQPGWPWSAGAGEERLAAAAPGPAGSLYVAVRGPEADHWVLHRLDAAATELPGFPVKLPKASICTLTASPTGVAYTACEQENAATDTTAGVVSAVGPDGSPVAGWPIRFDGGASLVGFRPNGTIVISAADAHGPFVTVVRPNGSTVAGWPRSMPNGGSITIDGRGRIHLTIQRWEEDACAPAISATYRVLRGNGSSVSGWPVKVRGWASEPAVGADGSMTIVTGAGRAIRYAPDGTVVDGWPVRGVKVTVGCSGYVGSSPTDAGSGSVVVTGGDAAAVTLLTPGGRVARGWPVALRYELAIVCRFCTGSNGGPIPPAIGKRGIYVAAYGGRNRPRIVAIDRDGSLPAKRQHAFGKAGDEILWVRIAPSGRVWMALSRASGENVTGLLVPVANDRPLGD